MDNGYGTAMVAGLFTGGLLVSRLHRGDQRALVAALRTNDLDARVDTMASLMEDLVTSGSLIRAANGRASDFFAGLDYGSSVPPNPSPSPTITVSTVQQFPRPLFSRGDAASMAAWPGVVSQYNADGYLVNPGNPGGNGIFLGKALATREPAAFLMGLASVAQNDAGQAALFDAGRDMALAAQGGGVSPSGYVRVRGGDQLWGPVVANGTTIASSTTETNLAAATPVNIPAGYFRAIGDEIELSYDVLMAGASTDTWQQILRWGSSTSGTALCTGVALDIAAADYARVVATFTCRQPNTGGTTAPNGIVEVSVQIFPGTTVAPTSKITQLTSVDTLTYALPLWLGAVCSVSSASDTATLVQGRMIGYRQPVS